MFEHLKELNPLLHQRYATVLSNIKSGANTFYDALGNLIDNYLKALANRESIQLDVEFSSGRILRDTDIKRFLFENAKLSKAEYDELRATIRIINEHSHGNEKSLNLNNVKTNLDNFFNVYIKVAKYYNPTIDETFDSSEIDTLFKSNLLLLKELELDINNLKEELEKEKNVSARQNEILKKIKIESIGEDADQERINELTLLLNDLKDMKISLLNKKLDDAIDLLIEQKTSIRENRIISLATIDRIIGIDHVWFESSVARAIEVVDEVGFDNHINNLREEARKKREADSGDKPQ